MVSTTRSQTICPTACGPAHLGDAGAYPDLRTEYGLQAIGCARVAGVDEAGRGPWAGPVCAAAVVLPLGKCDIELVLGGVDDSKRLSPSRRNEALQRIVAHADSIGVGWALSAEIDECGIVAATRQAMMRAVASLGGPVDALVIDYVQLPRCQLRQHSMPKADSRCLSVAAASIVAKVTRDRLMTRLDIAYPGYGFAAHKGYGTRRHADALSKLGPCPIHRMSWNPLRGARA